MHGRTSKRIAAAIALLTAATLGNLGFSGAAPSAQAASTSTSAPTLTLINCFQLYSAFNNHSNAGVIESDSNLYFNAPGATNFCQWRVGTTNNVVIRLDGFEECLALNASLNRVYLHGVSGCDGTLSYTVWHFAPISGGYYALQLQYDYQGIGVNKPCLYSGFAPATVASCASAGTDQFFQYLPVYLNG